MPRVLAHLLALSLLLLAGGAQASYITRTLNKPVPGGVAVVDLGPAANAPSARFDGKPVEGSGDLPRLVGGTKPGASSIAQVWRNGATRDVAVTVAELNDDLADPRRSRRGGGAPEAVPQSNRLGLVLSEVTPQQRRGMQIEGGLRVENITGGVRSDLRIGDVILAVNGAELNSLERLSELGGELSGSSAAEIRFERNGQVQTTTIRTGS